MKKTISMLQMAFLLGILAITAVSAFSKPSQAASDQMVAPCTPGAAYCAYDPDTKVSFDYPANELH